MPRLRFALAVLLALPALGCPHRGVVRKKLDASDGSVDVVKAAGMNVPVDVDDAVEQLEANFSRVHFSFDSVRLTDEGARLLDDNARILVAHPGLVVEIQGHADARGATGYNLALGTLRAQAARSRLIVRGVLSDRLPTVTYGEERPRLTGDDAEAWAENRRVEFRVVAGGRDGVVGTVD